MADTTVIGETIDAMITYQVPDEYLVGTVLLGAIMALLVDGVLAYVRYQDKLKAEGWTKVDHPFGATYLIMIVIVMIFGGLFSYFGSGIALGLMGHQDAPAMVYYAVSIVLGAVWGWIGDRFLRQIPDIIANKLKISTASDDS